MDREPKIRQPTEDPDSLLNNLVVMTPEEEKLEDRISKRHFEEDREELYLG